MDRSLQGEVPAAAPRFETVDLLRGLSILAVVLLHGWLRFYLNDIHVGTGLPRWLAGLLLRNGGGGVTMFFAISGFLITLTSVRRFGGLGGMRPRLFYRIRFARIAPLLLLEVAVLSLLHWASLHASAFDAWHVKQKVGLLRAVVSALTFHLNWLEAKTGYLPANWDVMWSLSVEEMFYLFFPVLCIATMGRRSPLRRVGLPLLCLLGLALALVGPWVVSVWITDDIGQEKSYLAGMASIAFGCLAALAYDRLSRGTAWRVWTLPAIEAAGWLLIAINVVPVPWHWERLTMKWLWQHHLGDPLLPLGTCLVMVASVLRRANGGGRLTAPLRWFGRHSYEIYLTHEFVVLLAVQAFKRWHGSHPGLWVVGMVAVSAPLGWAVARWFSEPMNRRLRGARPPAHRETAA